MVLTRLRVTLAALAGVSTLLGCAHRATTEASSPTTPELSAAEGVIDAFYSFDSTRLKTAMAPAAASIPRIVFYQGWAGQAGTIKCLQGDRANLNLQSR
jgi:hypothetical protein